MKIRVTGRGIYGKGGELPIGTEVKVAREPTNWRGRYEIIEETEGKTLEVASPEPEPEQESDLAREYESLTGDKPDGRWSDRRIQKEIDALLND